MNTTITYDEDADAISASILGAEFDIAEDIQNLILHFNAQKQLIGIEILDASEEFKTTREILKRSEKGSIDLRYEQGVFHVTIKIPGIKGEKDITLHSTWRNPLDIEKSEMTMSA